MKFEINRLSFDVSDEEIKNEIKRVAELISDTIIPRRKFDELSKISTWRLCKKYGSWENVLKLCGLEHRYSGIIVTQKMRNNITRKISDIELIDELKRVSKQIGKIELSQPEFKENSKIHPTTISRRFGSWSKGLKVAGLKEVRHGRRHTEFEYFENLLNVWTHYGKQPSYGEMSIAPSKISANTYRKRFGTWYLSLQAFIIYKY